MSDSLHDLRTAIDDLTPAERAMLARVAAEHRDAGATSHPRMAALWQALAVLAAESVDRERSVLADLERGMGPVVRPLTAEELAEVRFDDETPQEPPC
jgi:hypothetical protein